MRVWFIVLSSMVLSSSAFAVDEPQWSWNRIMSTTEGIKAESGLANVVISKGSLSADLMFNGKGIVHYKLNGSIAGNSYNKRAEVFKSKVAATFHTSDSGMGEASVLGVYTRTDYKGENQKLYGISCHKTIILSDDFNVTMINRVEIDPKKCIE